MLALYKDKFEYDIEKLYESIKARADEDTLIKIIGTRPGWMIKKRKHIKIYLVKI